MSFSRSQIDPSALSEPPLGYGIFPPPDGLDVDPASWWAFVAADTDALVLGDTPAVLRVLGFVWPQLKKPVRWCEPWQLTLPARYEGTLVVQDLHELKPGDQERLLDWCSEGGDGCLARIITTASPHLVALVESGAFSRRLYERIGAVRFLI